MKLKCSFPILYYLHSTTPFNSFILSLTTQGFSYRWPCCFWDLLLTNLFHTTFLFYVCIQNLILKAKYLLKIYLMADILKRFCLTWYSIEASKTTITLACIFPNKWKYILPTYLVAADTRNCSEPLTLWKIIMLKLKLCFVHCGFFRMF